MSIKSFAFRQGTQEWLNFRQQSGIGASEAGAVLGVSSYVSIFDIFSDKVGMKRTPLIMNESIFWGKKSEQPVSDSWEFFDNTWDNFGVPNYVRREDAFLKLQAEGKLRGEIIDRNKHVFRKCRKAKGIIVNDKYPWLFISPDRIILKNQLKLSTGQINDNYGYLECKQISFYHSKQYESGIPPEYDTQVIQGMICLGIDYGELAVIQDGNRFKVTPYDWNQEYVEKLLEATHEFWYGNVIPAREVYHRIKLSEQAGDPERVMEELWGDFQQWEPEPTNEENFSSYVQKTRKVEVGESMIGDDALLKAARNYNAMNCIKNVVDKAQLTFKNQLIDRMSKEGVDEIHFDGKGWVRNRAGKNQSNPTFRVSDKIWPYEFKVANQLAEFDFDEIFKD